MNALVFLLAAIAPYTVTFTSQHLDDAVQFNIKIIDVASRNTVAAPTLQTAIDVPTEFSKAIGGRLLHVRAVALADRRAEVTLDVSEDGANIQHALFVGKTIENAKYSGEPISLNLRDADIKDVLHMFAQLAGLNIAVDPDVKGTVTIDLVDVPWDQALDLILRQHKLIYTYRDGVMTVLPR